MYSDLKGCNYLIQTDENCLFYLQYQVVGDKLVVKCVLKSTEFKREEIREHRDLTRQY